MAERSIVTVDRSMLPANNGTQEKTAKETDNAQNEDKHLQSVVKNGRVVSTKPSIGSRIKSLFIAEDVVDVKSWLIYDVGIPFVKDTVLDLLEMSFFGTTSSRRGRGNSRKRYDGMRKDYSASYKPQNGGRSIRDDYDTRGYSRNRKADYRNIVLSDRYDAKEVVAALHDRIDRYGNASVADLFELVDQTSDYTDTCYGWTNINQIGIKRVGNGYLIDVDRAENLED